MKHLVIIMALIVGAFSANAQTWQKVAGRWQYTFLRTDSTLTPPQDTLKSAPNGSLAIKNSMAYFKDNAGVWRPFTVTLNDEWVSTLDFGAIPNDTTKDYSTQINAALSSGARCVMIPAGKYKIKKPLLINSNTVIFGYGAEIKRDSAIDNIVRNNADGVTGAYNAQQNIRFYGVQFNGARENFAGNCTIVAIGHAQNVVFQDCEFRGSGGAWHCLEINGVRDARIEGCYFHDANGQELLQMDLMNGPALFPWFGPYDNAYCDNIVIDGNVFSNGTGSALGSHSGGDPLEHNNIVISNNIVRKMDGDAFNMFGYRNITITGNTIDSCNLAINQYRAGTARMVENWVITNNTIKRCANNGLNLFNIKGLVISGNIIDTTRYWGISVQTSRNVSITDNVLKNLARDLTGDYGAIELNADTNVIVRNNIGIKDTAGYKFGVYTLKATNIINATVDGNIFVTNGATGYFNQLSGSKIKVGNNVINDYQTPLVTTVTGTSYSSVPTDGVINADATSGNKTITVNPTIFNTGGLIVRKTDASANTVTVVPLTGTINGVSSVVVSGQGQAVIIKSDYVNLDGTVAGLAKPGGVDMSLQYKTGEVFDGSDRLTWNNTNKILKINKSGSDSAAIGILANGADYSINLADTTAGSGYAGDFFLLDGKNGHVPFRAKSSGNILFNAASETDNGTKFQFYGPTYQRDRVMIGTNTNSGGRINIDATGQSYGLYSTISNGNGIYNFVSGAGKGLVIDSGTDTLSRGIYLNYLSSQSGAGGRVYPVMTVFRAALSGANHGQGTSIDFEGVNYAEGGMPASPFTRLYGQIIHKRANMDGADASSQFVFKTIQDSLLLDAFTIDEGKIVMNKYGQNTFSDIAATYAGYDASGNMVEKLGGFRQTGTVIVSANDAETTLIGSGAGSLVIPANTMKVGKSYRVTLRGTLSTDASNPASMNWRIKFGSTEILASGNMGIGASRTNVNYDLKAEITCRSVGSLGTVVAQGLVFKEDGPGAKGMAPTVTFIDTTTSNTLNVTVDMTDGSAGNNCYAYILIFEEI